MKRAALFLVLLLAVPSSAATLNAKVTDLALPTASAGTASLTGLSWRPGFSMGLLTKQTGSSSALLAEYALDVGFAVGTTTITQYSIFIAQNDAQNPATTIFDFDSSKYFNIWNNNTNAGSQNGVSTITHDTAGLTLTAGTTTATEPDAAYESSILALDSAAFSNTKIGNFTSPLSTGNTAVTGVGFKPDVVIFFLTGPGGFTLPHAETQVDANAPNGIMIGATNGTNQWVANTGVSSEGGDELPEANRYFLTNSCIAGWFWDKNAYSTGNPVLAIEASITSLDSGGFTLNWTTVDTAVGGTNHRIGYIALKMATGYNVDVHTITTPTSTGTFSKTGMSFVPGALIGVNVDKGTSTDGTNDADSRMTVGVTDGTTSRSRSIYSQGLNGVIGSSVAKSYQDMSNFLSYRSGSGSTAAEEIAFSSWNSDGYTLNSTTAPASGSATGIIAFGPGTASGGGGGPPPCSSLIGLLGVGCK